jgi:uncharacterized protein (DUF433 family)
MAGAFSTGQVARLTELSARQIVAWDTDETYQPSLLRRPGRYPFGRIYSFDDVIALRVLAHVRGRVSDRGLRELARWLKQQAALTSARRPLYIDPAGHVSFIETAADGVVPIDIASIVTDAERRLHHLQTERDPCDIGVIRRNRYVLRNEWVVAGTRIPVWMIQELSASGSSTQDIVREFPILTDTDVEAALAFDIADAVPLAS